MCWKPLGKAWEETQEVRHGEGLIESPITLMSVGALRKSESTGIRRQRKALFALRYIMNAIVFLSIVISARLRNPADGPPATRDKQEHCISHLPGDRRVVERQEEFSHVVSPVQSLGRNRIRSAQDS